MKTFSQFITETTETTDDYSSHYQLKKGEARPTPAHSGEAKSGKPKHVMHVIHRATGEEIGKIEPYSAYRDKKKKSGSRIVLSRTPITQHSFSFHKDHGPRMGEMGLSTYMKHNSLAGALHTMAREHQAYLQKNK